MKQNTLVQALLVKPFFFLFLAEIFSQVAMNMMNFILIIVAFNLTNSNTAVSGIVIAFTIPAIFFGILAGVFVDQWNKKVVLFITNLIRGVLLLALFFTNDSIAVIYAVAFGVALAAQFFIPAETPMIPLLVPKRLLFSANALFGIGIYGSLLLAYALSSPFLLYFGGTNVFLVLAIIYFVAAFLVLFIRRNGTGSLEEKAPLHFSFRNEITKAFRLITENKKIKSALILLSISQILILVIGVIGPGYAKDILQIDIESFPLLFVTPAAFGMVIGAVILDNFFHDASRDKCATVGVFICGLAMLALPFVSALVSANFVASFNNFLPAYFQLTTIAALIFLAFFLGFGNALVFVPSNTLIQEQTTDRMRGKIYGTLNSLIGLLSIFPVIMVGSLADTFGVAAVMIGIAFCILIIGSSRIRFR